MACRALVTCSGFDLTRYDAEQDSSCKNEAARICICLILGQNYSIEYSILRKLARNNSYSLFLFPSAIKRNLIHFMLNINTHTDADTEHRTHRTDSNRKDMANVLKELVEVPIRGCERNILLFVCIM